MRRLFSISLILLFWIAPLAAVLPGIDESRLPMCCRRHGVHHCAMPEERHNSNPIVSAPSFCQSCPATAPATIAPQFALPTFSASLPGHHVEIFVARSLLDFIRVGQHRTQEDRGPPPAATA
jgi:hypothetical protein